MATRPKAGPLTAIVATATAILSGWAMAAVATDLISAHWPGDRVFCLAIGFLTMLFAATSVPGSVLLMMRHGIGRYLIAFGSAVALLTFGALLLAETTPAWLVYLIPVLPLAAMGSALHRDTGRWCRSA